jgi:putative transcriptional regulator
VQNNINEIRKTLNLSQEDLANKTGVSRQTINSIENGKFDPSLSLLFKLIKVLDKNLDEIFIDNG